MKISCNKEWLDELRKYARERRDSTDDIEQKRVLTNILAYIVLIEDKDE